MSRSEEDRFADILGAIDRCQEYAPHLHSDGLASMAYDAVRGGYKGTPGCGPMAVACEHGTGKRVASEAGRFSSMSKCFTKRARRWTVPR